MDINTCGYNHPCDPGLPWGGCLQYPIRLWEFVIWEGEEGKNELPSQSNWRLRLK